MAEVPKLITTEDGSHSLYVPDLKETYHSFHGALQESRHVFIEKGLSDFKEKFNLSTIHILEIGLGTGLNALLAAEWAFLNKIRVEMTSIEAFPLSPELVKQLNYPSLLKNSEAKEWFSDIHSATWEKVSKIHESFLLQKIKSKVESVSLSANAYDVVFFDAFAPNKQAELWGKEILQKIWESQTSNSYFVTYCAKGQLKRDLKALGYQVETLDGPPGKKEMVRGIKY